MIDSQELVGFLGGFSINFQIAPGLGIGPMVSIGFGEVAAADPRESRATT